MALYRQGKAAMDANGIVTGTGTNWQSSLTLIRPGATILFLSSPIQMAVVNKVVSDTQINAITTSGAVVPSSDYAILLSDSLTVDGLAQDVAETLRYYQSQETAISEAVDFFKDFDLETLQALVEQAKEDAAASQQAAEASQQAAEASQQDATASQQAASDAEAIRDEIQQIIDDAGDQSTLVVLAQPDGDKAVGIQHELSGSVQRTQRDKNSETVSILDFGAKANDSTFDNQYKIQAAIDAANGRYLATGSIQAVYVPNGVFWVGNRGITNTGESTQNGILSIQMKSGVRLYGDGTIKAKGSAYGGGAYYRIIGSDRGARVQDVEITGITLDGNVSNQIASTQCSNLVLEAARNILIDGIKSVNSNGNGMMVRGRYPDAVYNVRIVNCYVYNCSSIGIQSSQFNGLVISNNTVDTTANNCIDVYGDTGVAASDSNGVNFSITGNTVRNSQICGIFPETVAHGTVAGNSVYNCVEGIHLNRIYSIPKNIVVTGNNIFKSASAGIWISGDMESVTICGNTFSDWTGNAIQLGAGSGNVSNVFIHGNTFNPSDVASYVLRVMGGIASRIEARNNTVRNNVGLAKANLYYNTATTTTGVNVDSWALTAGSVESTGLQMYRSTTRSPTVFGSTTGGTASYTTQSGQFMRIGEIVYFTIEVAYSGMTGTGTLSIGNLPWAPNASIQQPEWVAACSNVTLTAGQDVWALPQSNGINLRVRTSGADGVTSYLNLSNTAYLSGRIRVSGWYYL